MRRASSFHSYGAAALPLRGVAPLRRPLRVRTAMYVLHSLRSTCKQCRAQRAAQQSSIELSERWD